MNEALQYTLDQFNNREWTKQGTWPGTLLWFSGILEGFSQKWTGEVLHPEFSIDDYVCIPQPHGAHDCYIGSSAFGHIRKETEERYRDEGIQFFQNYIRVCEEKINAWYDFIRSPRLNPSLLSELPIADLAELLHEFHTHLRLSGAFMDTIIVIADFLGDLVGREVQNTLNKHSITDRDAFRIFLDLHTAPTRKTLMMHAESSLKDLQKAVITNNKLGDLFRNFNAEVVLSRVQKEEEEFMHALMKHAERFAWLNTYSFSGEPHSIRDIIEILQLKLENDISYDEPQLSTDDRLQQIIKTIQISSNLDKLLKITTDLTYINTAKDDIHHLAWQFIQPLMREIAHRLNGTISDLTYFLPDELERAVREKSLDRENLQKRKEGWLLIKTSERIILLAGKDEIAKFKASMRSMLPKRSGSLNGIGIYPGIVHGRVRILFTAADCRKVEQGDIVVATNTNPDFIPAMRRAGAFITDTGNLICHAVIAAREFKKPCVIQTLIATQVLIDGEEVEVDGNSGAIKRLRCGEE